MDCKCFSIVFESWFVTNSIVIYFFVLLFCLCIQEFPGYDYPEDIDNGSSLTVHLGEMFQAFSKMNVKPMNDSKLVSDILQTNHTFDVYYKHFADESDITHFERELFYKYLQGANSKNLATVYSYFWLTNALLVLKRIGYQILMKDSFVSVSAKSEFEKFHREFCNFAYDIFENVYNYCINSGVNQFEVYGVFKLRDIVNNRP